MAGILEVDDHYDITLVVIHARGEVSVAAVKVKTMHAVASSLEERQFAWLGGVSNIENSNSPSLISMRGGVDERVEVGDAVIEGVGKLDVRRWSPQFFCQARALGRNPAAADLLMPRVVFVVDDHDIAGYPDLVRMRLGRNLECGEHLRTR